MAKNAANLFRLSRTSRLQFAGTIGTDPRDKFAKTFVAKADMLHLWPCTGAWNRGELAGAIAWSISSRIPITANLQLLHTFAKYRRLGVATLLCNRFLEQVASVAQYFRVSAEPEARVFYESLGIQFLGVQKSGCFLSIGRLNTNFADCCYSPKDKYILKCLTKKGRGGCVSLL